MSGTYGNIRMEISNSQFGTRAFHFWGRLSILLSDREDAVG
jgi:hypothetical protein